MNSQNTPVHIRLWHHDFWRMAVANLLLTMSVYILIPTFPLWMVESQNIDFGAVGLAISVFGIGLFSMGAFMSYLVQHYRRNQVFFWAVVALIGSLLLLYYVHAQRCLFADEWVIWMQRFLMGASFGLAQMVLSSTLVIDTCESYQRTEANHSLSWFGRFSLSLGPLAGLCLYPMFGFQGVVIIAAGCALAALILVMLVKFPFRAPEDHVPTVSLDRFFLPQGIMIFLNLWIITLAMGLILSMSLDIRFYSMLMVGFLLAIIAQRFVFREADLKSEVVSGLLLMGAALLMLLTRSQTVVSYVAPQFIGCGLGIIASRFLLFFIKLSRHCQRGTSQSTFILGWESGLVFGMAIGYAVCKADPRVVMITALLLLVVALLLYQFTHNWFLKHKNR